MSFMTSSQRRLRLLFCAFAATALALAATAAAANAAPSVTLTHDPDLITNPVVAVDGTGFTSPTPVLDPGKGQIGLYAAQTALVDGEVVVGAAQQWIRPLAFGGAGNTLLNEDGSFSSELEVDQVIGTAPDEVDCAVVQCYISTWQAHGNPVSDQLFTQSPIYFAPTIVAEPAQGIAATGQTIAVDGGGVEAAFIAGNGVNMSQIAIVEGEVKTGPARWIRASGTGANQLTANGTFSSDLTLSSTFTSGEDTINCGLVQCAVAFWPGHTNPTPESLLAQHDISFAYSPSATVTPTTNLPETQQVTISGSGFNPGSPGVYVSQVAQVGDAIVTPPPGGGDTMQWVRPSGPTPDQTLNPDGSFATSVTVSKTFKDAGGAIVDCAVVQCSVITWRAHSNPSTSTLYTSAALSFSPPVTPPAPVDPTPPVIAPASPPSAKLSQQKRFELGTKARKLSIATVRCGDAACQFQKPKRVAVKIGKQKLWLAVTGPKRAAAGKVAKFGVRISSKAARRLAGRKARVRFEVRTSSDSGKGTTTVDTLLVGAAR